jgi:hypothetical protein
VSLPLWPLQAAGRLQVFRLKAAGRLSGKDYHTVFG